MRPLGRGGRPVIAVASEIASFAQTEAPAPAPMEYDPRTYWSTLHRRGDLSAVGQAALPAEFNAWLYRAMTGSVRRFVRRHRLDRPPPASVFDVGVGIGYWVGFWRSLGVTDVSGCDLVPEAVERVATEAALEGMPGSFVVADIAEGIAIADRTFPLVSCFNVLLHVTDDAAFARALANVAGLVEPGGALLLVEPILLDESFELPPDPRRHSRARHLRRYRAPLEAAGLRLADVRAATVLAGNPMEARSARAANLHQAWWRWLVRTAKSDPANARWLGPIVLTLDRLALASGAAPSTKIALFRRPG